MLEESTQIQLSRNGVDLGNHSFAAVKAGLRDGTYQLTDMAWYEGSPDWVPLYSILVETKPVPSVFVSGSVGPARWPLWIGGSVAALVCVLVGFALGSHQKKPQERASTSAVTEHGPKVSSPLEEYKIMQLGAVRTIRYRTDLTPAQAEAVAVFLDNHEFFKTTKATEVFLELDEGVLKVSFKKSADDSKQKELISAIRMICAFFLQKPVLSKTISFRLCDDSMQVEQTISPSEALASGISAYRDARFSDAISSLSKVMDAALDEEKPIALNLLGLCYFHSNDFERAIQCFQVMLKGAPSASIYWNLGCSYFGLNQSTQAYANLALSMGFADEVPLWLFILDSDSDKVKELLAEYLRARGDQKWPSPVFRFYLGQISAEQLIADAATAEVEPVSQSLAIEDRGQDVMSECYFFLGEFFFVKQNFPKARKFLEKCIQENRPLSMNYTAAGVTLQRIVNAQ